MKRARAHTGVQILRLYGPVEGIRRAVVQRPTGSGAWRPSVAPHAAREPVLQQPRLQEAAHGARAQAGWLPGSYHGNYRLYNLLLWDSRFGRVATSSMWFAELSLPL